MPFELNADLFRIKAEQPFSFTFLYNPNPLKIITINLQGLFQ
jgi:hypothetical protein